MAFAAADGISGRRLTALSAVLAAAALFGAASVALKGEARLPRESAAAAAPFDAKILERAAAAEGKGDVTAAVALYREAVARRPGLADRRSPEFLGAPFEAKVRRWVADLKARRVRGEARAYEDASYLFRRMYGGCG